MQALTEDQGELDEKSELLLEAFMGQCPDKLGALKAVADRAAADADFLGAEARRLSDRRGGLLKIRERCRGMARDLLQAHEEITGETKIKTPTYTAYLSKRQSVVGPSAPEDWPDAWRKEVITTRTHIDKAGALSALKALPDGESIEGLSLVTNVSAAFR